jgi:hypothetical protein
MVALWDIQLVNELGLYYGLLKALTMESTKDKQKGMKKAPMMVEGLEYHWVNWMA